MKAPEKISLSPRELEIMKRVARGDTDYCISVELKMSERTVESHKRRIFAKCGVQSRTGAVLRLLRCRTLTLKLLALL